MSVRVTANGTGIAPTEEMHLFTTHRHPRAAVQLTMHSLIPAMRGCLATPGRSSSISSVGTDRGPAQAPMQVVLESRSLTVAAKS
jgi:hypothetical protein